MEYHLGLWVADSRGGIDLREHEAGDIMWAMIFEGGKRSIKWQRVDSHIGNRGMERARMADDLGGIHG